MVSKDIREEFKKETRMDLGTVRCMGAHCEMCTVEIKSKNGRTISDPGADIEVTAKLKVRDFTTDEWSKSGKGAGRKNLRVLVNLETAKMYWKGKELKIVNHDEIMDGIQELLTGAMRERVPLNPDDPDKTLLDDFDIHAGF